MDYSDAFRLVNLAVGVFMVLGGISQFFPLGFQSIIIGCYVIIFGICTALLEFQIPPQVSRYASFLFSFVGRGIFYVFVGSILLHDHVLRIIAGSLIGIIGLIYIALEFVPSIEPPANMREADGGWGAEQSTVKTTSYNIQYLGIASLLPLSTPAFTTIYLLLQISWIPNRTGLYYISHHISPTHSMTRISSRTNDEQSRHFLTSSRVYLTKLIVVVLFCVLPSLLCIPVFVSTYTLEVQICAFPNPLLIPRIQCCREIPKRKPARTPLAFQCYTDYKENPHLLDGRGVSVSHSIPIMCYPPKEKVPGELPSCLCA
ncbi:hypothetical protein EYC80_001686 [Monilinia laxa]|uniref:Uncharacterized protein n=1 Tax=Monilinia laxa TaxID=61186 RepID=A0A5N6K5T7_MONLA|nr:hypothetical protein EYC80_001686 [Monilinia laxa]